MKNLLFSLLLTAGTTQAQIYLGIGATHKGVTAGIGGQAGPIDIGLTYDHPMSRRDKPRMFSGTIGYEFAGAEDDYGVRTWTLTPAVGIASKTHTQLENNMDGAVGKVLELKPIYGLEAGWNRGMGKLYLTARYAAGFYFGIGMKAKIL